MKSLIKILRRVHYVRLTLAHFATQRIWCFNHIYTIYEESTNCQVKYPFHYDDWPAKYNFNSESNEHTTHVRLRRPFTIFSTRVARERRTLWSMRSSSLCRQPWISRSPWQIHFICIDQLWNITESSRSVTSRMSHNNKYVRQKGKTKLHCTNRSFVQP